MNWRGDTVATMTRTISSGDDLIDIRDVIARVEELEHNEDSLLGSDEHNELTTLRTLLEDTEGLGGDEQWRGDWYPLTLILDSHFEDYARELAEDIGAIDRDAAWPNSYIDWEAAAAALQMDYSSVTFDGTDYWTR